MKLHTPKGVIACQWNGGVQCLNQIKQMLGAGFILTIENQGLTIHSSNQERVYIYLDGYVILTGWGQIGTLSAKQFHLIYGEE